MEKTIGTIITLGYSDNSKEKRLKDLTPMIEEIENMFTEKEGLKLYVNTSYGRSGRVHHHILVNKEIDSIIRKEWRNGHISIEYITNTDHYKEISKYFMN